jgi:hypothetical protein
MFCWLKTEVTIAHCRALLEFSAFSSANPSRAIWTLLITSAVLRVLDKPRISLRIVYEVLLAPATGSPASACS